jgi:hypothetical protein
MLGPVFHRCAWGWLPLVMLAGGLAVAWGHPGVAGPPAAVSASPWRIGETLPIAVSRGRAEFRLPTPRAGSRTLVIVSTLAKGPGPYPIRLSAQAVDRLEPPALARESPRRPPQLVAHPPELIPEPAASLPPAEQTFHLMVRDGDPASASNYRTLPARLRAVGRYVQIYVDSNDVDRVAEDVLRDLVVTFDDHVLPLAARGLGLARDVDGDGRFTILITGWLAHLADGRIAVDGFVRGADLDPDLGAPFGNRRDMMYLSAHLKSGPHLRTVLAHEYTHAITASHKAFGAPKGARGGFEEEGWLDEALAHLVEDRHGFSRSNLDYRVSAFLSWPERYRLVVEDYYAADLFRSHGNRGSTYLFLRWCADHYGPELLETLIRSPRRGTDNLEAATGVRFADLFRRWSIALALDGLDPSAPSAGSFATLDLRGEGDGWPLAGPRMSRVSIGGPDDVWTSAGTSSHFAVVGPSPTGTARIVVSGPPEAQLQVTAVPLPDDLPQLDLALDALPSSGGALQLRARLHECAGQSVRLVALAWEPLVPPPDYRASGPGRGGLDQLGLAAAFGTSALPAHGRLVSKPIRLEGLDPHAGPVILKIIGLDAQGRRVAAWAEFRSSQNGDEGALAQGATAR